MAVAKRRMQMPSVVEQFDELRTDYDAARKTRFKRRRVGVQGSGSHADYHYRTWTAYAGIMETARDLFRNHSLIGQGIRRLVSNVLRGGFTLDVKTGDKSLDADLSARWYDWSEDADQCDIQGEQCWHGLERLALQSVLVDGDMLTLPTRDGQLQQIEAHRLRTPSNTTRNVIHGVLIDDLRKRLEYWVTREDISPTSTLAAVANVDRYPARLPDELTGRQERAVFHHYMPDRVSQTRGITVMAPVIDTAGMGDDLMFATLVKAQMTACVTILRELSADAATPTINGGGLDTETDTRPDGTVRTIAGWQPGMEIFGYRGEKLSGFAPNVPNAEFFKHAMLILSIIAVNLDLPVAALMLDPSNTNFSGWRGAMDQARERFQAIQRWLVKSMHTPAYRWKVRQWAGEDSAILRAIQTTQRRQRRGSEGVDAFGHVWHAQEWPYIEPVQDAMGDVIQERNLLISPRRRCARRGMDFEDLTREQAEDAALRIRLGNAIAQQLNTEIGEKDLGGRLTWRDIMQWPMPEGVQVNLGPQRPAAQPTSDSEDKPRNGHSHNRIPALEMNGHAN